MYQMKFQSETNHNIDNHVYKWNPIREQTWATEKSWLELDFRAL